MADHAPTAFRLWTRLTKSLPNVDSGEIIHGGIFHDESEDIEGDIIPFEMLQKSFDYLGAHGKHNWNHRPEIIGDVLSVAPVTTEEAIRDYGVEITGRGTALTGSLYPLIDPQLAHQDLKTAHHRFLSRARLGYSVDGYASRDKRGQLRSVTVPRVAICDQPINGSTVCQRMVKGFVAMVGDTEITDADLPEIIKDMEDAPELLVDLSVPGGPDRLESAGVVISTELFGHLIRKSFTRVDSPPLGGLRAAIDKQSGVRSNALKRAFDALRKA